MADDERTRLEQIRGELEHIRQASDDGLLRPEEVVQWARRNKRSAIHGQLEWDDTKAAHEYRVEQVRQLIRVVVIPSTDTARRVRAYVSLPSDRVRGGGYADLETALAQAQAEMVREALAELRRFRNRFTHLPQLNDLFAAVERLVDAYPAPRPMPSAARTTTE